MWLGVWHLLDRDFPFHSAELLISRYAALSSLMSLLDVSLHFWRHMLGHDFLSFSLIADAGICGSFMAECHLAIRRLRIFSCRMQCFATSATLRPYIRYLRLHCSAVAITANGSSHTALVAVLSALSAEWPRGSA